MAAGFDLAAAETVLECRRTLPGLRLVAVVPFEGQQNRFSSRDRELFERIIAAADETVVVSAHYHKGVYMLRNDYLVAHAARIVAWFDGSPGGTHYTLRRAVQAGRRTPKPPPPAPITPPPPPTLFRPAETRGAFLIEGSAGFAAMGALSAAPWAAFAAPGWRSALAKTF